MAERLHVHADLVRPAGGEGAFEQAGIGEAPCHLVSSQGRPAAAHYSHAYTVTRVASDGRRNFPVRPHHPLHYREIFALYRSGLQLPNQIGLRLQSLRHDEQPARALVEPMHDAGPGNRRELR